MKYPKFFDEVEKICLKDELSLYLGTFEEGIIEFSFLDIVKMAGHSCPTVAGAYLCTMHGLKALYVDEVAKRGEIKVEFKESVTDGVAGVIGSVIANITGATTNYGFKGIGANFNRCDLMFYNSDIDSNVRFTRVDTKDFVDVYYDPSQIQMQKPSGFQADFGKMWQKRVQEIFENQEQVIKIKLGK